MKQTRKDSGFTLIELLVVISIIGLLSSIVLASLNSARAKARDARRRVDLRQIQTALEFYFNDNGAYPSTSVVWWGNCSNYGSHPTSGSTGWIPNLAPQFIPVLPLDPKPNGASGCYLYKFSGTDYKVITYTTVEKACPVDAADPMHDPVNRTCTFAIYTSGGANY